MSKVANMGVGVELACARRVRGLSIEDVSNRTKVTVGILSAVVERIEYGARDRRRYGATAIVALIAAVVGFLLGESSYR